MPKVDAWESVGPGKFSCRADRRAYLASLDGADDIASSEAGGDSSTLCRFPLLGLAKAGFIVHENSQGFVTVDYHDREDKLEQEWERVTASYPCECDCDDCDSCHPVTLDAWRVSFYAHSGCSPLPVDFDDETEARRYVARKIRRRRSEGFAVQSLGRMAVRYGREEKKSTEQGFHAGWEFTEPEDAAMVPDTAGILTLEHVQERE